MIDTDRRYQGFQFFLLGVAIVVLKGHPRDKAALTGSLQGRHLLCGGINFKLGIKMSFRRKKILFNLLNYCLTPNL